MIPIVTPAEMAAIDAAADDPIETLIERAGRAVARAAVSMMGGAYGRRVVVIAGPGNNGADGRVAAVQLRRRGVRVGVVAPDHAARIGDVDLVVDAAFGTGLSRPWAGVHVDAAVPVLAVDAPSGIDGLTGEVNGRPLRADRTVTFVALKPGLLHEPGRSYAGEVEIVAIEGLGVDRCSAHLVEASDVAGWVGARSPDAHKWGSAVRVVGGSPGMAGSVELAASAAQRIAGYVQVAVPGRAGLDRPIEAVGVALPSTGWGPAAVAGLERVRALLAGPGLSDTDGLADLLASDVALVLDASALQPDVVAGLAGRAAPTIVTPHDGEFARIGGGDGGDRIAATRALAAQLGCVVLRKGPTTVIAAPDGQVRVVANGGPELATAGTGDVLGGVIVGLLGRGLAPADAAAAGAWLHAEAAGGRTGLVASDLVALLPAVLGELDA